MLKHFKGCNASYPEKVPGEVPQQIEVIDLEDGTEAHTCVDCGAFEVVARKTHRKQTDFPGRMDPPVLHSGHAKGMAPRTVPPQPHTRKGTTP